MIYTATNARLMLEGAPQVQPVAESNMDALRHVADELNGDYAEYLNERSIAVLGSP
jgi:hypothetical protein